MITNYQFGLITINGRDYDYDIEVRWNGEVLDWIREESHLFSPADIQRALRQNPEIIIFGTGAYGMAKVAPETLIITKEQGIRTITQRTPQAVQSFNNYLKEGKRVIGLFHLTC